MAIEEKNKFLHWNYFIALESDIDELSRFIEFTKDNFTAYSLEMARLLLAAASEVDVVSKLLCNYVKPQNAANNIDKYRAILKPAFPTIGEMKILLPRHGLEFLPWSNWVSDKPPDWWRAYNEVKHERNIHFKNANLKNTLNAISGLFVLLLHYYKSDAKDGNLIPTPSLFRVDSKFFSGVDLSTGDLRFIYRL